MAIEAPALHLGHDHDAPPDPNKSGEGYDRCPTDGCIEVEQIHDFGWEDPNGGNKAHMWSMFSADKRLGGCGANWTRTTPQGAARNAERNAPTKWLTNDGLVGRTYFLPSAQFSTNYEKAFGHK